MSGTISETILCERSDTCDCELHQALHERDKARRERDEAREDHGWNVARQMERERDEARRERDEARADPEGDVLVRNLPTPTPPK